MPQNLKPFQDTDTKGNPRFYKDGSPIMLLPMCQCGAQVYTARLYGEGENHLYYVCPKCKYREVVKK
jgi:DNA-directed RNA polymerase subunit RPC12/RpoP